MTRVLVVDDDESLGDMIVADLISRGLEAEAHTSAEVAFRRLLEEDHDVVVTDLRMPGLDGLELCDRVRSNRPGVPVIMLTAFGSLDTAVAAIRAGAYDFVTKPVELDLLAIAVERAARHRDLEARVHILREELRRAGSFEELLGTSPPMRELFDQLTRIAETDTSVLVVGESGTGKELVARALHRHGSRRSGPFVAVNCSAIPETLMESELFGHTGGAFTGALEPRRGLFVEADRGTLFLDEIGDLPISLQPKILRALEERRVRPVGADREVPVDVRVVAATNRDVEAMLEEGRFREDLFYRINVIQLTLPPLRARGADVLLLARHFLDHVAERLGKPVAGMVGAVAGKLRDYSWPGNVRELKNAVERAVSLTTCDRITVEDLPERIRSYRPSEVRLGGGDPAELLTMEEVERRYIRTVLEACGGNKTLAARTLGFDRKTLYRKLRREEDEPGD